jgi:alpha-amylase/alpha-mannosidase (GH57 family)
MNKNPLCVAILWHMHQPDYGNVQTGEIYLPWTRFHAVKDYYDMAALVEEIPEVHVTINVVPSLVDQLVAYGQGMAKETYATLSIKNPAEFDKYEKAFILRSFFQVPPAHMVVPYPRYSELIDRRGTADEHGEFRDGIIRFSQQDYRDLQVWFNLAWCGRELRRDPMVAALFHKGRNFSEDEKKSLLERQYAFIGRILPYYRSLLEQNRIELSVSPYYHPILPLLCDNRVAREALPGIILPESPFSYPGDAREQIRLALDRFKEVFGRNAEGMWPSEGSVSNAALALVRDAGLRWLASDEVVLLNSLQKQGLASGGLTLEQRYCAYRWGGEPGNPCVFFRDHSLSDLIGFTYAKWKEQDAVEDFLERLRGIHRSLPNDGRHYVVPVILDGENAWEHYRDNGTPFLALLYRKLAESGDFRTVTFSEYLDLEPSRESLGNLVAGSWIYGNLATWIGHPEKNRAWDFLSSARSFLATFVKTGDEERAREAFREMLIAEGSDWFWWYGDDHSSENAAEFDALFRNHVKNVYLLAGEPCPAELDIPIKRAPVKTRFRDPVHTISPKLDGRITDYYEWLAAGFAVPAGGQSMHRTERHFERVYYGYDARSFYVRLDVFSTRSRALPGGEAFVLHFVSPKECILLLQNLDGLKWECRTLKSPAAGFEAAFGGDTILEIGVPLDCLGVEKPDQVRFFVAAMEGDRELERFPRADYISVPVDPWGLDDREWVV